MLAIGIIGGMADCVPAGAAEMAGVPPTCIAVPAAVTGGAAPVQADGTVSAPTEVARPIPAETRSRRNTADLAERWNSRFVTSVGRSGASSLTWERSHT